MIAEALTSFRSEMVGIVDTSTKELLQDQLVEFQSQMKQEFQAYLAEALKQQQSPVAGSGSPGVSTPTASRSGAGSRGFFPTLEAVKKEIGRFRMLLDKCVENPERHVKFRGKQYSLTISLPPSQPSYQRNVE